MKKILLTGANGYIGQRLFDELLKSGYYVIAVVRHAAYFQPKIKGFEDNWEILELDFSQPIDQKKIPKDIEAAYYLMHSMAQSTQYADLELQCAQHFIDAVKSTNIEQVIYLSGMINQEKLSEHLQSRKAVEEILQTGTFALTVFRAGIIIGSGSASFEIIRDLVEKLPLMVAPSWLNTLCQPIGIRDVLQFLTKTLLQKETYHQHFDIAGPDILSYKNMLLGYAQVRQLKRNIFTTTLISPKISSYWLFFITSTSFTLAQALVDSMKVTMIAKPESLTKIKNILHIEPANYVTALERTLSALENSNIPSSWKDDWQHHLENKTLEELIEVPKEGCFKDQRHRKFKDKTKTIEKIWQIGGEQGWYYADWLWEIRGFLDKLFRGVGLNRGRRNPKELKTADVLDFWRVIYANQETGHLLLYAEMKLPGEAWLEFKIQGEELYQTATFRPLGLAGRLYWYAVLPFHAFIFGGMLKAITSV